MNVVHNRPNGFALSRDLKPSLVALSECQPLGREAPFGGAGTTIIAAEQTGRRARLIEIDPLFVTISIERWQRLTGGTAVRAQSGKDGRSDATASVSSREDR